MEHGPHFHEQIYSSVAMASYNRVACVYIFVINFNYQIDQQSVVFLHRLVDS